MHCLIHATLGSICMSKEHGIISKHEPLVCCKIAQFWDTGHLGKEHRALEAVLNIRSVPSRQLRGGHQWRNIRLWQHFLTAQYLIRISSLVCGD